MAGLLVLKAELCTMWVKRLEIKPGWLGGFKHGPNIEETGAEVWFGWRPVNSGCRIEATIVINMVSIQNNVRPQTAELREPNQGGGITET